MRGFGREMGVMDRQGKQTMVANVVIRHSGIDRRIMAGGKPLVGDSVVKVGRISMGFLCEKDMGKGFPIGVRVRACTRNIRKALTEHQRNDIAFRGCN